MHKEISELIVGVKDVAIVGKEILKDGKVNFADLGALGELMAKQEEIVAAFSGLADLKVEVKSLSLEDAQAIVTELIEAAKAVKAA